MLVDGPSYVSQLVRLSGTRLSIYVHGALPVYIPLCSPEERISLSMQCGASSVVREGDEEGRTGSPTNVFEDALRRSLYAALADALNEAETETDIACDGAQMEGKGFEGAFCGDWSVRTTRTGRDSLREVRNRRPECWARSHAPRFDRLLDRPRDPALLLSRKGTSCHSIPRPCTPFFSIRCIQFFIINSETCITF